MAMDMSILMSLVLFIRQFVQMKMKTDMQEAFNMFNQNGDGFITVDELKSVLGSLRLKQGGNVEDCRKMINNVDFMEFKKMMMRGVGFASFT
ncbi:hypothetical protein MTR67_048743 [Solanum verrucosum]|uniref:EF-hand domain-containing protein n=1 Tax=Solanum verrucosum TaxID=315347 RepID=A0AAF0UYK2_SOLVR|nr:hypothetical protein MTR67_048743 [Solanum verrucosum]